MAIDFSPYFKKYLGIVELADSTFNKMQKEHEGLISCKLSCSDCCYGLFDLTLVEAIYIKEAFKSHPKEEVKQEIIKNANTVDRKIYKIKRDAYKDSMDGKDPNEIIEELSAIKVRCPMLDENEQCFIYESRPITCRLYGIPTSIGGEGHTCGLSNFKEGESYPTVNLDIINQKLLEFSAELVAGIKTKFVKMSDMLVPLSMAILTSYDEDYLGIITDTKQDSK